MQKKLYCHFCGAGLTRKVLDERIRPFCGSCDQPIYENPIPATCVVVINDKNQTLLVKRNAPPKKGCWCLPGGFMELGETNEKAALRELKEETGLSGKIEILMGVTTNPSDQYDTALMIGYLAKEYSGALKAGDDASDAAFFSYDRLPEIAFSSHRRFIRIYYSAYSDHRFIEH